MSESPIPEELRAGHWSWDIGESLDSLESLGAIQTLEHFAVGRARPKDKSLASLLNLPDLRTLIAVFCVSSTLLVGACAGTQQAAEFKVVKRETWGWQDNSATIPEHRIEKITIHHGGEKFPDDRDPMQYLRALQSWSRSDKGWTDIPYHFVIDLKGTVYEARPIQYPGDTNTSYDPTGHALIQVVGDYRYRELSAAQLTAVIQLSAMLAQQYEVPVSDIRGHLDYAPGETDCPGENLYRYLRDGTIRDGVVVAVRAP